MSKYKKLTKVCDITTGKLDSNAFEKDGKYPFFTCAPEPLTINTPAFNADAILLAGNNAAGNFHLNRYKGEFNAYQRTYVITSKEGYNLDYIYYSLKLMLEQFKQLAQGSQTKFLTMKILESFVIEDLTIEEQLKKIKLLKNIDKKIEINTKINKELESLAKTIYGYWFLQYEFPNEEGKPYKSSGGKMVYNEELKREIPEGWKVEKVNKVYNVVYGKLLGLKELKADGKYDVYGANGIIGKHDEVMYTTPQVLVGCRGSVGEISYCHGAVYITNNSLVMETDMLPFVYNLLHWKTNRFDRCITGSVQKQLTIENISNENVLIPNNRVLEVFDNTVSNIYKQIINNTNMNKELAELRDWLLPMLMDGQITIK